jgi:hypothetical protein
VFTGEKPVSYAVKSPALRRAVGQLSL